MNNLMRAAVALMLSATMGFAQPNAKQLTGKWESVTAEDAGNNMYAFRSFEFNGNQWELWFTMYFDEEMRNPVFTFRAVGTYEIGSASEINGANNAVFTFTKKFMTLKSSDEGVIKNFGFANCELTPNQEADISQNGCSFLQSVANYGREYDLISLSNERLFLGARPADGNMGSEDKRPATLGAPLKKK